MQQMNASFRLSVFSQMFISQYSERRLLRQFSLVLTLLNDSLAMKWPEHNQCSATAYYCGYS